MSEVLFPFAVVAASLLGLAALLTLVSIVRGPSILDRMIASDVLFTTLLLTLGVVMVFDPASRTETVMLVVAATAFLSTITVARYVARRGRRDREREKP